METVCGKRGGAFIAALLLFVCLFPCSGRGEEPFFLHGSAEAPEGTLLVISLFASDPDYQWRPKQEEDEAVMDEIHGYLGVMEAFVEDTAASFGKTCDVVTDFWAHPELLFFPSFSISMSSDPGADEAVWRYIRENMDIEALLKGFSTSQCVFFLFLHTNEKAQVTTCTRDWYPGMPEPYEIVYLNYMADGYVTCPAIYAHELFHAFGAPDLYMEDAAFGISEEDVAYFLEITPHDIMLNCSSPQTGQFLYDRIENPVGDLTAYYIGLLSECPLREQMGLAPSRH